jgi:hypothetical protein
LAVQLVGGTLAAGWEGKEILAEVAELIARREVGWNEGNKNGKRMKKHMISDFHFSSSFTLKLNARKRQKNKRKIGAQIT